MPADIMDPTTAVAYGPFIQAAEAQYASAPTVVNPATITHMPAGYTLVRTIQMTDFFGPAQSRVFYGYVAVGGDPATAVVALRGTGSKMEWWDDFHWDLVPFTQVPDGGNVATGFYDIYNSIGTMAPGQQGASAAGAVAAEVAQAATSGLAAGLDPASLPLVVTGHSLGGVDVCLAAGGRRGLRRPLRRAEHRVLADLQPGRRRPVLSHGRLGPLPARHRRVRDQFARQGEVEPGLRPLAEYLHARAVPRHRAAGSGVQLTAWRPARAPCTPGQAQAGGRQPGR